MKPMVSKILPVWVVFALVFFAIGSVWIRLNIIRTTYSINEVHRKIEQTKQETEILGVKLSSLKSPKHLEALARKKFGLLQPRLDQVIHMSQRKENPHGP
jgi:cell division protein FtsL